MFNGQDWATHTMSLLLENTYELYGSALDYARRDATGVMLGEWVAGWFWDSNLDALGHNVAGAVEGTRDDMSRNEFAKIDWRIIAESLTAE